MFFDIKRLNPFFSHSFYAFAAKFTGGKTACVTETVCEMRVRRCRPMWGRLATCGRLLIGLPRVPREHSRVRLASGGDRLTDRYYS
jgi:hypothetical protein